MTNSLLKHALSFGIGIFVTGVIFTILIVFIFHAEDPKFSEAPIIAIQLGTLDTLATAVIGSIIFSLGLIVGKYFFRMKTPSLDYQKCSAALGALFFTATFFISNRILDWPYVDLIGSLLAVILLHAVVSFRSK